MKKKSVRLFKNDMMESLTHVHPIVPLLFWSPVVGFLLWRAVAVHQLPVSQLAALILPALIVWTLTEYLLHRYLFHFPAKSKTGKWLVYLFHGVHHDVPADKTRLVMPPTGAIIVLAFIWLIFSAIIPAPWAEPFCAFFIVGYLIYDYIHYATHHFKMRHPLLQALKHHHMRHHFSAKNAKYGVSSPLWDWVFGTLH
ncbi:MAG: fatty acid hydroxylase [Gammaproteobacteria bacterium]|nr:fatty acid hydroxylase [Gammaproteobacteria bacterium]